ncbi:TIM-barrel domain-containing protein [Paenibacillus sp. 1P07SE]|uniref:glycoside hydrolase family 31 protein n=1 Tax=Paenibacillus sp. 1P07SE TaxID=3132209 RepID=UPI0039A4D6CF
MNHACKVAMNNGFIIIAEAVTDTVFRVRYLRDHRPDPRSLLDRYGVVRQGLAAPDSRVERHGREVSLRTAAASMTIDSESGAIKWRRADGKMVLEGVDAGRKAVDPGFRAAFKLTRDERLYGLGDETRDRIEKRGHRARMWVKNVSCYAPVPYMMSSSGWAFYLNTSYRHVFDLGLDNEEQWKVFGREGELDYYVIVRDSLPELLESYTMLAGRPQLLPIWAYGLTFVCNQQADARELLQDAMQFRREDIPCDMLGLEPGWMSRHYDYTTEKQWHPERFYIPPWAPRGPQNFPAALERMGFKLSLWLCSDYDLIYEEERQASQHGHTLANQAAGTDEHPDDYEQDQRAHAPVYLDTVTKPGEAWFEHLKKFVDQGASAFKMDGARQVNEHPDRLWGGRMRDEEVHNLYPTLLSKQMHNGFKHYTGRRPMIYSSGGYTGIQRFAATWAGDTGGGPKPLVSLLNHSLSGHSNASCDMEVFTPAGIHFGFLQPWSQVNSWAYWRHPWLLGEPLLTMFRFYAKLRYRLLPYLYTAAYTASRSGLPMLRAMPLVLPDHPEADHMLQQYMLGDALLCAAFTDRIYLPAGRWMDYWTGEWHEGGQYVSKAIPGDRGGLLFVRGGAVLPQWPEMAFTGEKPVEELKIEAFSGGTYESYLYEDDGITLAHEQGHSALTALAWNEDQEGGCLRIGPRIGEYEDMPASRSYAITLHLERQPASCELNGRLLPGSLWHFEESTCSVRLRTQELMEKGMLALDAQGLMLKLFY